jgi:hypothetical protein
MESLLFARETGGFASNKHAHAASIQHSISNSEALIRRLTDHQQLDIAGAGSAGVLCCSWDDAGVQLAVGTDTCQLLIYNADKGNVTHTFDPVSMAGQLWGLLNGQETLFTRALLLLPDWVLQGHIEGIACAEFLPGTGGRLLVTAGPARDVSSCTHRNSIALSSRLLAGQKHPLLKYVASTHANMHSITTILCIV